MSINEFVAAQLKEVNDFERELSLLLENQQEGTEQSSSAGAAGAGAKDLNNYLNSSNNNHDNAINNTTLYLPVHAYTLPSADETNSNILSESASASASALEINSNKICSSKSLLDAKRTQCFGSHLVLAVNGAVEELGNNPTDTQIAAKGETLKLATGNERRWDLAHKLLHSCHGGANIPGSSDGCVAAVMSYGHRFDGMTTSVIQLTDSSGKTSIHRSGQIESQQVVSVYSIDGQLLQICLSIDSLEPSLYGTVGLAILSDHNDDTLGSDNIATYQDILGAGPAGLTVGNRGTRVALERLLRLKATTSQDKYTLLPDERLDLLKDLIQAHSNAGRKRQGAGGGKSAYRYVVSDGEGVHVGKAEKISDVRFHGTNNPYGLRQKYGKSYKCGPQPCDKTLRPTHKPKLGAALVILSDDVDWQKLNKMDVVGFRDNKENRERYIVILEDDERGLTAEQQYQQLEVPVMSLTADKKSTTADKKRKAKSEPEQKKTSRHSRRSRH